MTITWSNDLWVLMARNWSTSATESSKNANQYYYRFMYKWTLIITFQYINIKHFITLCLGLLVGIQPSVKYWLLAVEGQSGRSPLK